ncbi:MAG TPA: Fe-S-containing protein [Thermoanaerobaculia bacterium]|nr:Fe-S-containing protein [Thermoanaerobaculia bacterium]
MTETTRRFRPIHGVAVVAVLSALLLGLQFLWEGGLTRPKYVRVGPDAAGEVRLDVAALGPSEVRFFRFLNSGNQEVRFLVARDASGALHTAFDASESDFKMKRGFRHDGDWVVNNKCDTACRLEEVSTGGGCRPVPFRHRLEGSTLVLAEAAILDGWRYFR